MYKGWIIVAYRNLDEFITRLEQAGDVTHFAVGPARSSLPDASAEDANKAQVLTFPDGIRLVRNLFGTNQRIEQALRIASLNLIAERMEQLLEIGRPGALGVMISRAMTMFSAIRTTTNRRAPNEYQDQPLSEWHRRSQAMRNIAGTPALHATLLTGGDTPRMIAVTGNVEENTIAGQFWPSLEVGETVALVIGGDPAFMFAAQAPLPDIVHRSYFASWLRDKPLDMMRLPGLNMEVPSNAETVIAATVKEQSGDHTMLDVSSVWTKPNAIYPQFCHRELENVRNAVAHIMLPLMRRFLPGLHDLRLHSQFGVLTVDPSKTDMGSTLRQLWAVPISASIKYWLLLPETDDIDGAVEQLALDDVKSLSKLIQGKNDLGILLDASSKRDTRESSEPDLELEQVFWHFKRNWQHDTLSGES